MSVKIVFRKLKIRKLRKNMFDNIKTIFIIHLYQKPRFLYNFVTLLLIKVVNDRLLYIFRYT